MSTGSSHRDERSSSATESAVLQRVLSRRHVPRQQNRVLALALIGVVVLVFVTLMILMVLLHWAKVHHAVPGV